MHETVVSQILLIHNGEGGYASELMTHSPRSSDRCNQQGLYTNYLVSQLSHSGTSGHSTTSLDYFRGQPLKRFRSCCLSRMQRHGQVNHYKYLGQLATANSPQDNPPWDKSYTNMIKIVE